MNTNNQKLRSYTVMLSDSDIELIKEIARRSEMQPGTLARNLIRLGLDEAEILSSLGVVSLIGSSRKVIDKFKSLANNENA